MEICSASTTDLLCVEQRLRLRHGPSKRPSENEEFGGSAVLADEALKVLALKPGSTPSEIKEAYRDLVKVWHPDRFGDDLRLREKAERQLQLINEAYRLLQSNSSARGMHADGTESAFSSSHRYTSYVEHDSASRTPRNDRGRSSNRIGVGWIYRGLGIFAVLLAGYFAIEHHPMWGTESLRDSAGQQSAGIPVQQTPGIVHSTDLNGAGVLTKGTGRAKYPGPQQFQVRSLSAAETDRLETVCSRQKELSGQVAYQSCLKAQLDLITNPKGKPDLSTLREAERESIESVCSEARRRGPDSYNRCETEQVASLAAEPARPDLSALSDVDRHSIESACDNIKNREGPAAYNRCLDRFTKTLSAAK